MADHYLYLGLVTYLAVICAVLIFIPRARSWRVGFVFMVLTALILFYVFFWQDRDPPVLSADKVVSSTLNVVLLIIGIIVALVIGVVFLYRALRESLEAKRELTRSKEELEKRVAERTAELSVTNESLQREIAQSKRAEESIKASLAEKEVLLKEVHHRVKNNLQIISSLLSLQARDTKDQNALEALRESQDRVRSIALIHEMLYQTPSFADIDFSKYVKSLSENLLRTYGKSSLVAVSIVVDDLPLGLDEAISCGLIVNELVTNALKHAFPGDKKGSVTIGLSKLGDKVQLYVKDDGVGINAHETDLRESASLGLRLVSTLASQLGGDIIVEKVHGTSINVVFPPQAA